MSFFKAKLVGCRWQREERRSIPREREVNWVLAAEDRKTTTAVSSKEGTSGILRIRSRYRVRNLECTGFLTEARKNKALVSN